MGDLYGRGKAAERRRVYYRTELAPEWRAAVRRAREDGASRPLVRLVDASYARIKASLYDGRKPAAKHAWRKASGEWERALDAFLRSRGWTREMLEENWTALREHGAYLLDERVPHEQKFCPWCQRPAVSVGDRTIYSVRRRGR